MIEIKREDSFYRNFVIQGNPVGKARPRFTKQGYAYTDEKTKAYEQLVRIMYRSKYRGQPKATGNVNVEIRITISVPKSATKKEREVLLSARPMKKPDLDNVAKIILDALNGVAYEDDKQVTSLTIYREWGETPQVEVWILGG